MEGYRFITNFDNTEESKLNLYIAIKAVGITDFQFCSIATNIFGDRLPNSASLYFKDTVTERERELFWQAFLFTKQLQETQNRG